MLPSIFCITYTIIKKYYSGEQVVEKHHSLGGIIISRLDNGAFQRFVHLNNIFLLSYMLYKKLGVTRIIPFSQLNGKLPLPRQKQVNYLVIPIYATSYLPNFMSHTWEAAEIYMADYTIMGYAKLYESAPLNIG